MNTTRVHYAPGQDLPCKAGGAVSAGTLVKVSKALDGRNPVVATNTTDNLPLGVAAHDAAQGEYVTVHTAGVIEIKGSGVTAGSPVYAGASGAVAASSSGGSAPIGVALADADSATGTVVVALK